MVDSENRPVLMSRIGGCPIGHKILLRFAERHPRAQSDHRHTRSDPLIAPKAYARRHVGIVEMERYILALSHPQFRSHPWPSHPGLSGKNRNDLRRDTISTSRPLLLFSRGERNWRVCRSNGRALRSQQPKREQVRPEERRHIKNKDREAGPHLPSN